MEDKYFYWTQDMITDEIIKYFQKIGYTNSLSLLEEGTYDIWKAANGKPFSYREMTVLVKCYYVARGVE